MMKLEDRIRRSIALRQGVVVLRSDFACMGSTAQVGRVLAKLVDEGKLIRVSKGAFAKTRINKFTGQPSPAGTLESISAELFQKLKIKVFPSQAVAAYNSGATTQLPMSACVNTGRRRVTRNITVGNRTLSYENHREATSTRH